jgi:hypothetical protein
LTFESGKSARKSVTFPVSSPVMLALVRQTKITDFISNGEPSTPPRLPREISLGEAIFKVSPTVRNANTLGDGERGVCYRRVGKSFEDFLSELSELRDANQSRFKRLEDTLDKQSAYLQEVLVKSSLTEEKLSKTNNVVAATTKQLSKLLQLVTLREVINSWKVTSVGGDWDYKMLDQVLCC